jgi:pimeloyl-ACP methyl ester carboxylesterase
MAAVTIDTNGIRLHVVDEGDQGAPAVLLLHGFPDSSRLWRHQIAALTAAGCRVIAPDLRGFGESDRPADVDAYAIPTIVGDVVGVLDHLGVRRPHVVGHDWGAVVAWALAAFVPDRVDRLVAMSVGHPGAFAERTIEQLQLSWYMLLFQFEGVAEQWLSMDDWRNLRRWAQSHPDLDAVVDGLGRPGALTAGLNWYRANVPPESLVTPGIELPPVAADTLGVWSDGDLALTERQMTRSGEFVKGEWRYERVDGASHWLQLDAPDRVNELLVDFLGASR